MSLSSDNITTSKIQERSKVNQHLLESFVTAVTTGQRIFSLHVHTVDKSPANNVHSHKNNEL